MTRIYQAGDAVQITCAGRTVPGTVTLASPNGKSLAVEFEAILANHVGMMSLLWDAQDRTFYSVMNGVAVELAECQAKAGGTA